MAKDKKKPARVLTATIIEGVPYKVDDVVNLPEDSATRLTNEVDYNPDAVQYALSINGGVTIDHVAQQDSPAEG